jgi:hypothetical protein
MRGNQEQQGDAKNLRTGDVFLIVHILQILEASKRAIAQTFCSDWSRDGGRE